MAIILAFYTFAAKDAPGERKPVSLRAYAALLRDPDSRWFMFFYFITFGGFVGLANALPLYFTVQYHVSASRRPARLVDRRLRVGLPAVGGLIADRIGGIARFDPVRRRRRGLRHHRLHAGRPGGAGAGGWSLTAMPRIAWISVLLFSIGVLALGMGNGAVFQLIPLRFRHEIGLMTGLVGCAGGVGGFFLAQALGVAKEVTGGFGAGFLFFGVLALLGFVGLAMVKVRWRTTWAAVRERGSDARLSSAGRVLQVTIGSQRNLQVRVGFVSETGKRSANEDYVGTCLGRTGRPGTATSSPPSPMASAGTAAAAKPPRLRYAASSMPIIPAGNHRRPAQGRSRA